MTEHERYIAEEIAENHAAGILSRREAMRRLGLLGISASAATSMLAAFTASTAGASATASRDDRSSGADAVDWAPIPTEEITFAGPRGTLMAAWAPAFDPHGGVLVIHENRGLNAHIRSVAGRLAATGYSALALDLLSEEGGTGAFPDEAAVAAALAAAPPERFDADMKAAVTELTTRLPRRRLAATGFCFGGAMVWRLLAAGESRLSAAAPFYGPFPAGGDLRGSDAAVLAIYGGLDARVNATRPEAEAALAAARLRHQVVSFTDANHAFFNETGANYNVAAAAEAYRRLLAWFGRFVDKSRRRHED